MGLETPTFVSDLVPTNPISTDLRSQGDDHIRNLKIALQNTFPNASRAVFLPSTTVKTTDFTVTSTDINKTFLIDTSIPSTSLNVTLPILTASNDGWFCHFVKTNSQATPYLIVPGTGTLQSGALTGLARTRRSIPGAIIAAFWTGSGWIVERAVRNPVGEVLDFSGGTLPVGYEWASGQTLTSSQLYPDYFAVFANLGVVDRRGRIGAGRDDMGGSVAGRITAAGSGITGSSLAAVGGAENVTLTTTQIPSLQITTTVTDPGHTHTFTNNPVSGTEGGAAGNATRNLDASASTGSAVTGITVSAGYVNAGQTAVNKMPPTIITNNIIVVE